MSPDGCVRIKCYTCNDITCDEGQECELQICWSYPCPPLVVCVSTTDTTTPFTTTPQTTTSSCPPIPPFAHIPGCGPVMSPDGCVRIKCYTCDDISCDEGQVCELQICWSHPCPPLAVCVSTTDTTTPEMTTTSCPPLPPYARMPGCGTFFNQDGCLTVQCFTCAEVCGTNPECELQSCWDDPCFLPAGVCGSPQDTTTPFTTTSCPPLPPYARMPGCGTFFNQDGCLTVQCFTCAEACGVAECELQQCWDDPCFLPAAVCGSKTKTTTPCPMIECSSPCVWDQLGDRCPTCACPPSCQDYNCTDGSECQLVNVNCFRAPCFPQPNCVATNSTSPPPVSCQPVTCLPDCVSDVGPDGCTTCTCPRVCNMLCIIGYECVLVNVTCERDPCFPEPQCVPKQETTAAPCRMYKCAPDCVPGNGSDGCPTCECPPSCQTVKCSAGHECQLVNVTCKREPCFPQPQCVAIKDPCTGTPNTRRCGRFKYRWTYNSATDTCKRFRHYGCTPSLNTFLSPKACKNKCQGGAQSICEDVACEKDCYTYTRKNKCPKCICPNPCKGFKCREGYECKLRDAKCEDKDPKPFCAKKS